MHRTIARGWSSRSAIRSLVIASLGLWLIVGPVAAAGPSTAVSAGAFSPFVTTATTSLATGVPPRPSHVLSKVIQKVTNADGAGYVRLRITWREPAGVATRFKVIGLLQCVNSSAKTDGKPCVVAHMFIPAADLRVLATLPGTARSAIVKIKLFGGESSGGLWNQSEYFGLLLGAYNSHGQSVLAIVRSATVCFGCTY